MVLENEDCVKGMERLVRDDSVDLIIADPPYNIKVKNNTGWDDVPPEKYMEDSRLWLKQVPPPLALA